MSARILLSSAVSIAINKAPYTILTVLTLILLITSSFADNPIIQTCFTADPAPLVYNNTVYVYVGHDSSKAPNDGYLMRYWKCYSSQDMVNWTDHGIALATKSVNWSGGDADAAQVVYRDGKFYYYISTQGPGGVSVGVAVATSPLGPFTDIGKPLVTAGQMTGCNATHSWRGLDPTVFIDDDGQAYLYWGNNVCYWVKLNSDMISCNGSISCLPQNATASFGPDFEEAPWVYKRNSVCYMIYASEFPECIRYATCSNPTGSWIYKGQIMAKQPNGVSNTIHPGVCDFGGNSYFFYHNAALPGGGSYRRSVCVEQFNYNTDGAIPTINGTAGGVTSGVGNLNPYDTTQAETICWESGVRTQTCSEGGIHVDSINNGDYIKIKGVDFGAGAASFMARVASATSGGNIELRLDSQTGTLVGTCAVAGTGGWQTWATKSCTISGATGIHDLFLKFTGGSGLLFNFNWWKFDPVGTKTVRGKKVDRGYTINIGMIAGKTTLLCLDFPQPGSQGNLNVCLFDVTGRLIGTLFTGRLSSTHLALPINQRLIRPSVYAVRVSLNNTIALTKTILFR